MSTTDLLYFDDLRIGQRFASGSKMVGLEQMQQFAQQFDPQAFHLDPDAAKATFFGGLAASGWHTAAVTMRLIVESVQVVGGVIGAGAEIAWPKPTRPGDTLHVESEVLELIPSRSRPERGIAIVRSDTFNQNGEVVQTLRSKLVVPRKHDSGRG